ncbi:MAG: MATE family efflux transporter [Clostridia bacterium]|nr:MATE family efflux transporter [Clostridia bacterium]
MKASLKLLFGGRRRDVDMTEGNIVQHIVLFALPLLVGNIFQQLYNTVDTWVVGNYVSEQAFSAVGSVGPIINMLIGFFMGLSSGAGVVISQYYGARKYDKVHDTVHTCIVMTLVLAVVFTAVGIAMTPTMLRLMNTPEDVFPESRAYLTIYFSGIIGLMFYNIGSGILRAVGDSQRPFYFLVVSAVLNTVLDLVFVIAFDMGVAGVAYATIISQGVSAILCIITLLRTDTCIRLSLRHLKMHWDMMKKIIKVGIPAAIQMTITAFSNVFVQSYINYFGTAFMGGWTAYAKIDQFMFMPMQSIALASTTFVGQNLGKNQVERSYEGIRKSMVMATACTFIILIPIMIFAPYLVQFFNDDPLIIEYGTMLLRWISPFYVLCCANQILSGALRGAGNSKVPMVIMICSFVVFRQIYLFVVSNFISNTVLPIAMSYPAGWLMCSALTILYFKNVRLEKTRLVEDK